MFTRFLFKRNNLVALLCATFMGAANAAPPIILNNAELTTNYSAYGLHQDEDAANPVGLASHSQGEQQSLVIDSNNVKYNAYKSVDDGRIYVLKFVNNRWVSAEDGNGDDGIATTIGDVAPLLNGATGPAVADPIYTKYSKTVLLAAGANGEVYLGYIDEVGGDEEAEIEGDNNLHLFELTTVDNISSWQLLTTLKLSGEGSFDGSIYNVHDMELEVDSQGNVYAALNTYRPALGNSGRVYHGQTKLVKYTKSDNAWHKLGDTYTAVTSSLIKSMKFFASSLAISATDDVYYAFSEYVGSLDGANMQLRVMKLDESAGAWNEVGDEVQRHPLIMQTSTKNVHNVVFTLDLAVSPSGKLFLAAHSWSKFLTVTTYDPFEAVDEGGEPRWKLPYSTAGGQRLDQISQTSDDRNIRPPFNLNIAVGSDDLPYVAYGENGEVDSKSVVLLGIRDELIGDEIESNWTVLNIPLAETTTADSSGTTPTYINIALGANNRPHLLYRDDSGNRYSRALRANVRNTSEVIELSVVEEQFDAGNISIEIADIGDSAMFAEYTFGGLHLDKFVASDLAKGKITLAEEGDFLVGANINYPYLLLDVFTTELASGDLSHAEPVTVKVSFEASEEPAVQAKRGYAFAAYLCGETPSECTVNINEDDPILFEFIQSKISSHSMVGSDLPDGIAFDVSDPFASFEGKASFTATAGIDDVAEFNFSVTATPIEGALNHGTDIIATPITIDMTINVTNTPIHVEADYLQSMAENQFLNVMPTVDIAVDYFDIVWDTDNTDSEGEIAASLGTDFSWLKFDRLTGELSGQSRYVHAGTYKGTVYATGYDEGERNEGGTDNRLAFDVEIVVDNVPLFWDTPEGGQFLGVIQENDDYPTNDTHISEAVQYFYIKAGNPLPAFLTFDIASGVISGKPGFEDESVEPYTFTVVAQGWDEGEYQELIHNLTVNHRNAPPSLEFVVGVETEGKNPVFIDILTDAYDVDQPGYKDSYDDEVLMVFEDDEFYLTMVTDSEGVDLFVEHTHTGFGELEIVSNGFIYTPSVEDPEVVSINYVVKDSLGLYQGGEVVIRVNVLKEVSYSHTSKAGSMGSLLGLFAFMFIIRVYKKKA